MNGPSHILGVILAGGSARRLFPESAGGGDKGLADLAGRPMLEHVIERFRPQVGSLILNANGDPARFAAAALTVVPDLDAKAQGPMGGLVAAMDWAERFAPAVSAVATVTTDVPFLPLNLVARLAEHTKDAWPVLAVSDGRRHPTIGLWPLSLKPALQTALARDDLSLGRFARSHDAIAVAFPFGESGGVKFDPFFNANTPDELKEARALLAHIA